jgi:hypothetical protein
MTKTSDGVFMFDVDNTLIDNNRVRAHLKGCGPRPVVGNP